MTVVVGIDLSSFTVDLVRVDDDDTGRHYRFLLPPAGTTAFDRARLVAPMMPKGTWWDDVALCGIEATFSRTFNAATALARTQGAVLASIPLRVTVLPTASNEWQRLFLGLAAGEKLGDRTKRKRMVKARAVELGFGDASDLPQDAYDAYGIAWATRELCERAAGRAA